MRQGLGDLDDLLLADPQVRRPACPVVCRASSAASVPGARFLCRVVDVEAETILARDVDVLGDRQIGEQVQLLEHDADAARPASWVLVEANGSPSSRMSPWSAARRRR